ncbi:hypothetical protein H206_01483 [Candidatus Electrothrix aarhusensis]|uniref:Uncharacterized protein n=1 Tax=Candidatus Electrothrix aarhusensis TaxID=1859131 RepID=A0A444IUJ9_9BACT|nr:hypothetical protein H206_01483 [Candidatus Electrothrix aarhusensis]
MHQITTMKKKLSEKEEKEFQEWLKRDDDSTCETYHDYATYVLPDLDYKYQLIAIKNLVAVHKDISDKNTQEIETLNEAIEKVTRRDYKEYLFGQRGEQLYVNSYVNAAHSMAAVGMLAPFMESIFFQSFLGIEKGENESFFPDLNIDLVENKSSNLHQRWVQATHEKWDCHFVWHKNRRQEDLVKGILQLSEATGLKEFLPEDLEITLKVLFAYRNKMFHFGLEWPSEEREKFWQRIQNEKWPSNWIEAATKNNDEHLIIYISDAFITHCLDSAEAIIDGISRFVFKAAEQQLKQYNKRVSEN